MQQPPTGITTFGEVLAGRLGEWLGRLPGEHDRTRVVETIIARLCKRVGGLMQTPAKRVALAVVDGQMPWREVESVLIDLSRHLKEGTLEAVDRHGNPAPYAFFVGAMKKHFRERGLDWPLHAQPKP